MSWLWRGKTPEKQQSSPAGGEKKSKPTKAHLGETSKFYYNEKLKRWCVEGEEGEEGEAETAVAPPPISRNVSLDYLPGSGTSEGNTVDRGDDSQLQQHEQASAQSSGASMPGSPRRGASLRQRYYDPGYMSSATSASEGNTSGAEQSGRDSMSVLNPDGGNKGKSLLPPNANMMGSDLKGKKPITLFVPQMRTSGMDGDQDDRKSSVDGLNPPNFATPWNGDQPKVDDGDEEGEEEEEVVQSQDQGAYPAAPFDADAQADQGSSQGIDESLEAFNQVPDQYSHLDNPRLDDLASANTGAEQAVHAQTEEAYYNDTNGGEGLGYQPGTYQTMNSPYDYGLGPDQQQEADPGVVSNQSGTAEGTEAEAAGAMYNGNDGYDYGYESNVNNGGAEQPQIGHHQWHSLDLDSQYDQSLEMSSYNSSYNNMADQLGTREDTKSNANALAMTALQQQLEELTRKLQAVEEERDVAQQDLSRERSKAPASTSFEEQNGVATHGNDDGHEEPATPSESTQSAGADGKKEDTYSTIKRSLQQKIEELELNDLEKHKLLLENYRLQESIKEKDEEVDGLQSDMNDLLVCLGQESAKVKALIPFAEQLGQDVDTLLAQVEEESIAEEQAAAEEYED